MFIIFIGPVNIGIVLLTKYESFDKLQTFLLYSSYCPGKVGTIESPDECARVKEEEDTKMYIYKG